jgi:hypothetical protein
VVKSDPSVSLIGQIHSKHTHACSFVPSYVDFVVSLQALVDLLHCLNVGKSVTQAGLNLK